MAKEKENNSLIAFREATMELDNIYSRFPKSCGLSEAEYWSLLLIYEGAATQSEISSQLFMSRQTLNSTFKLLRRKGLVRLEPYEENQRSKQALLTEEGKRFVEENVLQMHRIEEKAWQKLDSDDAKMLTKKKKKYGDLIKEELKLAD